MEGRDNPVCENWIGIYLPHLDMGDPRHQIVSKWEGAMEEGSAGLAPEACDIVPGNTAAMLGMGQGMIKWRQEILWSK